MKPLRCYYLMCRKPYPKVGEPLILRDASPEEGYDYQVADWGKDFSDEIKQAHSTLSHFGKVNDNYYPECLCLTDSRNIVRAIIPVSQHKDMGEWSFHGDAGTKKDKATLETLGYYNEKPSVECIERIGDTIRIYPSSVFTSIRVTVNGKYVRSGKCFRGPVEAGPNRYEYVDVIGQPKEIKSIGIRYRVSMEAQNECRG